MQIGITESGLPWYQFRYINKATVYEGVMAQDVLKHTPAAVLIKSDGFMAVNYSMLGYSMLGYSMLGYSMLGLSMPVAK